MKVKGTLKPWVVVVEEGHRFEGDPGFRTFVYEAGKFVKKLIIVTPEAELFKGMVDVYKAMLTNELNTVKS